MELLKRLFKSKTNFNYPDVSEDQKILDGLNHYFKVIYQNIFDKYNKDVIKVDSKYNDYYYDGSIIKIKEPKLKVEEIITTEVPSSTDAFTLNSPNRINKFVIRGAESKDVVARFYIDRNTAFKISNNQREFRQYMDTIIPPTVEKFKTVFNYNLDFDDEIDKKQRLVGRCFIDPTMKRLELDGYFRCCQDGGFEIRFYGSGVTTSNFRIIDVKNVREEDDQ